MLTILLILVIVVLAELIVACFIFIGAMIAVWRLLHGKDKRIVLNFK